MNIYFGKKYAGVSFTHSANKKYEVWYASNTSYHINNYIKKQTVFSIFFEFYAREELEKCQFLIALKSDIVTSFDKKAKNYWLDFVRYR